MDLPNLVERISRYPHMKRGHLRLIILVGVFGDFDSLEYAQLIRRNLNRLESSGIKILIIGLEVLCTISEGQLILELQNHKLRWPSVHYTMLIN